MEDDKVELTRVGSLCKPDYNAQLLDAWLSRNISSFLEALEQPEVSPDQWYDDPHLATILYLACKEENSTSFAKALLDAGAQPNDINRVRKKAPIHVVVESGKDDILEILLSSPNIDINILDNYGNTPLHVIAKQKFKSESQDELNRYKHCVQLLLNQHGIKPNVKNRKGYTPILLAADYGAKEIVQTILEHTGDELDVDDAKTLSGKTARQLILEKYPELAELLPEQVKSAETDQTSDISSLFHHLYHREYDSFMSTLNTLPSGESLEKSDGSRTLLQYSAENGLDWAVRALLEKGANPNGVCASEPRPPALLACYGGHPHVLYIFLSSRAETIDLRASSGGGTALHAVLNSPRSDTSTIHRDYKACLDLLLKFLPNLKLDINATDIKGNTALHYAAKNEDDYAVITLLKHGAYIGIKNVFGDPPLANISPGILENFLNECLDTNGEFPREDTYEVTFSYKFLVPPPSIDSIQERRDSHVALTIPLQNNCQEEQLPAPEPKLSPVTTNTETEPLLYISKSRDLKHLLKHPIFTSFLDLKWHRVRIFFYVNLIFYLLFVALLTLYILLSYSASHTQTNGTDTPNPNNTHVTSNQELDVETKVPITDNSSGFWWGLLVIFLALLFLRELFQFIVSPKQYVRSPENYLEILLFIAAGAILFCTWVHDNAKPHFSAIAILLSWAELVLLIGRHPRLSVNIEMFKTVSWNFLKFLAWYAILIVAFALSFYTLFRDCGGATECGEEGDSEENFFLSPGMSVFKTVVMLTGEFDAASIPFVSFPGTSHIVFVLFVFLIAIVLFNLLNGLAVSDTQAIRDDAEVVSYISRVKLMSYIESMFQGSSVPFVDNMKRLCCCWPARFNSITTVTNRVRLFPDTVPNNMIRVLPNIGARILFTPHQKKRRDIEEEADACCLAECGGYTLDPGILKRAMEILSSRGKVSEMEEIKELLTMNRKQLQIFQEEMEDKHKKLGEYEKRFDSIEKSMKETEILLQRILNTIISQSRSPDSSDEDK